MTPPLARPAISRVAFLALAFTTIATGLAVHFYATFLGPVAKDMLGDALWAAMVAWWVGAVAPAASLRTRGIAALAICFAVETSQRYHGATLDALRQTTAGHLVLGSGFDPRDFAAYTLGVLAAMLVERVIRAGRTSVQQGLLT
ncbi:MAG TPA: DUF2809 domain-containing protein [Gemmatimonadaceae bacterium]|nr:DUF2809 domain-containing protein [Gemmatimonadaceae bacterium]